MLITISPFLIFLTFIRWYDLVMLVYFALVVVFYFAMTFMSLAIELRRQRDLPQGSEEEVFTSSLTPGISLLAPAYNEELNIAESVHGLLKLRYPNYEVIVVNDGSRDDTIGVLQREFALRRIDAVYDAVIPTSKVRGVYISPQDARLTVVDKANGGKADALNCGLNLSNMPLFCSVDADSLLEPDALLQVARPMVECPERVVAVGGAVRIANGATIERGEITDVRFPRHALPAFQVIEYLRAFLAGRTSFSSINCLLIISGAFGLFRRDLALAVGGYRLGTVGEDAELVVRLHRYLRAKKQPYRMIFIARPVCWTEAPESLRVLGRQRRRWHRGLAETLWLHKRLAFNPRYGLVGMLGYPYFLLVEFCAPIVEMVGYIMVPLALIFRLVDPIFAFLLLALALICGISFSTGALLIEEIAYHRYSRWSELARMVGFAILENFGYRQLTVYWRLQGVWDLLRGNHSWGSMERKGLTTTAPQRIPTPLVAPTTAGDVAPSPPEKQSTLPTDERQSQESKDVA